GVADHVALLGLARGQAAVVLLGQARGAVPAPVGLLEIDPRLLALVRREGDDDLGLAVLVGLAVLLALVALGRLVGGRRQGDGGRQHPRDHLSVTHQGPPGAIPPRATAPGAGASASRPGSGPPCHGWSAPRPCPRRRPGARPWPRP